MNCRPGLIIMILISILLAACGPARIVTSPSPTQPPATPAQPTAMAEPSATPQPATAQPAPTSQPATAQPAPTAQDTSGCPVPPEGEKSTVGVVRGQSFCITWIDSFSDERGFRVLLEYLRSSERFSYEVGPNTELFAVPPADAPPLDASGEQCMARKDFMVTVIVLRPGDETSLDSMASEGECWLTPPESAAQTPVVVYQSRSDGSLRAIALDTGVELVLADPTDPGQPLPWAPAPDGRSIALITGHGWNSPGDRSFNAALWTVGVDESNPRKLLDLATGASAPQHPLEGSDLRQALVGQRFPQLAWTPDGRAIVVVSAHEGQLDLYTVAADGSGVRRLTNTPDLEFDLIVSPDGREVAYSSALSFGTGAGLSSPAAWVQPIAGGERRAVIGQLTDGRSPAGVEIVGVAGDGTIIAQTGYVEDGTIAVWAAGRGAVPRAIYQGPASNIAWNPQQQMLALAENSPVSQPAGGRLLIWSMGDNRPTSVAELGLAFKLDWSPDGQSLLICSTQDLPADARPGEARRLVWDAGSLHNLGVGGCEQHVWSADGRLALGGGGSGIVAAVDGSMSRPLPEQAFPAGWHGQALLFFAPSKSAERPWQLYRAIGERDEPLGAPIAVQPSEPQLVTIAHAP